jgi:hypothetical protein
LRNNEDRLSSLAVQQQDVSAVQNTGLSFAVPTEFVDLPSKGKLYPVGHPLRDKTSIEVKQMTAKEEDILTSESYIKKGIVLDKFLESIIINKNIKVNDLCTADRSAIFLSARILAYGPEYKVGLVCPKCNKQHSTSYNLLESPKTIPCSSELSITDNGTFFIDLPVTGWKVECKSVDGNDEKQDEKKETVGLISSQLNSIIISINGATDKTVLKQAIDSLPARDSRHLRAKYKELMPNIKLEFTLECDCGNSSEVDVPITLEFFWPKS